MLDTSPDVPGVLLFADANSPGPIKATHFAFGSPSSRENEDIRTRRLQIQQDTYASARSLRRQFS